MIQQQMTVDPLEKTSITSKATLCPTGFGDGQNEVLKEVLQRL